MPAMNMICGQTASASASHKHTSSVISIGSVSGICGKTDTYSYAPSKVAIHQLTRNLAVALCDKHIRVNAIAALGF